MHPGGQRSPDELLLSRGRLPIYLYPVGSFLRLDAVFRRLIVVLKFKVHTQHQVKRSSLSVIRIWIIFHGVEGDCDDFIVQSLVATDVDGLELNESRVCFG